MATPFDDPRMASLTSAARFPEALCIALDGKALVKVSLRTKAPAEAKNRVCARRRRS